MSFQENYKINLRSDNFLHEKIANTKSFNQFPIFSYKLTSGSNLLSENNIALNNLSYLPYKAKKSISILKRSRGNNKIINSNKIEKPQVNVISNADEVFSNSLKSKNLSDRCVITPKKTTDITKIKGWRRKQFLIERPTTVEFYNGTKNLEENPRQNKNSDSFQKEINEKNTENVDNAFVCEILDDFLNEEAKLQVNYEIPHLYAEVGIKLTSEEIYSKPNLSEEEFNKVGLQYCTTFSTTDDSNYHGKRIKSEGNCCFNDKIENFNVKTVKILKKQKKITNKSFFFDKRRFKKPIQKQNKSTGFNKSHENLLLKETKDSVDAKSNLCLFSKYYVLTAKLIGLVIYPGSFSPLHPLVQNHLFKLRSYYTKIDKNWANFAVSAVQFKKPKEILERKILPVYCSGKIKKIYDNQYLTEIEDEVKEIVQFLVNSVCEKEILFSAVESNKTVLPFTVSNDNMNVYQAENSSIQVKVEEVSQNYLENYVKPSEQAKKKFLNGDLKKNMCNKLQVIMYEKSKSVNQTENSKETPSHFQLGTEPEKCKKSTHKISNNGNDLSVSSTELFSKNQEILQKNEKNNQTLKIKNEKEIFSDMTILKEKIAIKDCRVLVEKIKTTNVRVWCMEHNSYNCTKCSLNNSLVKSTEKPIEKKKEMEKNVEKNFTTNNNINKNLDQNTSTSFNKNEKILGVVPVSPKACFDPKISSQLSTKLKDIKFVSDTIRNIGQLKTLVPNAIELVSLNFMKQSFLNGLVKIWLLPSQLPSSKSRAFLSISDVPPVLGAFDISTQQTCFENPPKIINDLLSAEHKYNNNEYGIIYCNGKFWEIHGTLNTVLKKENSCPEYHEEEVEQIFSSVPLPEIEELRRVSTRILGVKTTKWWVLDMSQKFSKLILSTSSNVSVSSKYAVLSFMKSHSSGYFPLTKDKNRSYGIYYFNTLQPFILIGPFYVFEKNDIFSVQMNSSKMPFAYSGKENVNKNYPLKFFINSVIMHLTNSEKTLKGIWLYDKVYVDDTCYLEVITADFQESYPRSDYSLEREHGYSMKSLTNYKCGKDISKSTNSNSVNLQFKPVAVYLYFDIFSLGYINGELQSDNSILITHPFSSSLVIRSKKIGDLFVRVLKSRIKFIPENLVVKWFITKYPEDLGGRKAFDKFWLNGVHFLCKSGIFSLLKITEEKIRNLGLDKLEVMQAASKCRVLKEIIELKKLKTLLFENSVEKVTMKVILQKAVKEIERLKEEERTLGAAKIFTKAEKCNLMATYVTFLNSCSINDATKIKYLEKVAELNKNKYDGKLHIKFKQLIEKFQFGKKYLMSLENKPEEITVENTVIQIDSDEEEANNDIHIEELSNPKSESQELVVKCNLKDKPKALKKKKSGKVNVSNRALIQRLETKMYNLSKLLKNNALSSNFPKYKELIKKLNRISSQLNSIKNIFNYRSKKFPKKIIQLKKTLRKQKGKKLCQTADFGNNDSDKLSKIKKDTEEKLKGAQKKDSLNSSQNCSEITFSCEDILSLKNASVAEKPDFSLDSLKSPKKLIQEQKPALKNLKVMLTPLKNHLSSDGKILIIKNAENNKFQKISILNSPESLAEGDNINKKLVGGVKKKLKI